MVILQHYLQNEILAKIDKWEFLEGLAERGIERHYNEAELKEDITYANSHK